MKRGQMMTLGMVGLWSVMLVGCQPSEEEMATMFKQPPRPAELDRLEAMVGTWKTDVEFKMPGSDEVKTSSGQNSSQWAADKWMLTETWEHEMGEGSMMKGVMLTWWDAYSKTYRVFATDNYGGRSEGKLKYDEKENLWEGKSKGRDGMTGERVVETWTMKFTDPSTMEWTWAQYDGLGLFKHFEVTGTSRRQ